jgi:hypothetical protein
VVLLFPDIVFECRGVLFQHPFFLAWMSYTGRFIMFSVITNIYNKKTKGLTLMELNRTESKAP